MSKRTLFVLLSAALALPTLLSAAPRAAEPEAPERSDVRVKPTGPIGVEYRLAAPPAVGVALEIAITARVQAEVRRVTIEANATTARAVLVTPPTLVSAGDGVYSWTITVVPLAAEAGYLSVIVAGDVDGVAQARSVTVPLRSTDAGGTSPVTPADEEALIALPVQESP
jgi:hypothetical protein